MIQKIGWINPACFPAQNLNHFVCHEGLGKKRWTSKTFLFGLNFKKEWNFIHLLFLSMWIFMYRKGVKPSESPKTGHWTHLDLFGILIESHHSLILPPLLRGSHSCWRKSNSPQAPPKSIICIYIYLHIIHIHIYFTNQCVYIYDPAPPGSPPPPPPKGGYVTHMQPCIGITICLYWFMYLCLCVCLSVCWYVSMCVSQQGRHVIVLCLHTKILHVHIMFPRPPCGWVGGVLPSAAMYRYNYMFLLIYVWELFVCIDLWFVCMYVYMCPSKVDMSLFLCLHTKILHVHIMFPRPPCGWVGGVLPSAAMYRYNYMFVLIYVWELFVCIDLWFVCMYVCTCPSKVGMSFLLCMQTKILHIHIMFPPPPCGWVGGVLPSAAMYRYNYMFLLIYVWELFVCIDLWFVCMYVRVQARSACHFYCVCKQRYYIYT